MIIQESHVNCELPRLPSLLWRKSLFCYPFCALLSLWKQCTRTAFTGPSATCHELKDNTKPQEPVSFTQNLQKNLMSENTVKAKCFLSLQADEESLGTKILERTRLTPSPSPTKKKKKTWLCDLVFDFQMTLGMLLWFQLWGHHNEVIFFEHWG